MTIPTLSSIEPTEQRAPLVPHPLELELSAEEVSRFQEIMRKECNVELTFGEAKERALEVLRLSLMLVDPEGYAQRLVLNSESRKHVRRISAFESSPWQFSRQRRVMAEPHACSSIVISVRSHRPSRTFSTPFTPCSHRQRQPNRKWTTPIMVELTRTRTGSRSPVIRAIG